LRTVEIDPAMPKETVTNLAAKSLGLIQIPTDKPQSTHSS
jgi:hypothetical protein